MPRPRRHTRPPKQDQTEIKRDVQETHGSPRRAPTDQYQHFIPRFILRRFQVGPAKSNAERRKEYRCTRVDPEHVHYYDVATGNLDIRPIAKVYGVQNIYQDVHNTENINELEEKLAGLERQAASVITDLHTALPSGTFILKRRRLELLRKFLFIMHYRNATFSKTSFQVDHLGNATSRQWIECLMNAKGIQSAVGVWLHFLRYFLDTSHADIMRDAAELLEKYTLKGLERMISQSHFSPDLEHFPTVPYYAQADSNFLSIWEAAEGEEFVLTNNGFGLWEGVAGDCVGLHTIFVVSPRIAIILRNVMLRPELKGQVKLDSFHSTLLHVDPVPATPIYSNQDDVTAAFASPVSLAHYRSSQGADDSFVFKITKLSRPQTMELNSIVLVNMNETGSLTFLSRATMLRMARAFRSMPRHIPKSHLIVPLINQLTTNMGNVLPVLPLPVQRLAAASPDHNIDALSLVDVVLYMLLMQICTGQRQFPSIYDRAHLVHRIMQNAKPTWFAHEISQEVDKAFQACKGEFEEIPLGDGVQFSPLLPSIPNELSSQLFHLMIPYMSKLGAVMSGGEGILEELRDEVIVMSFLSRASCNLSMWHTLSCSNVEIPTVLSGLFKKGTWADGFVVRFTRFMYEKVPTSALEESYSSYDEARWLRGVCGMTGPTTNPISGAYYELTAGIIEHFGRTMLGSLPAPYSSQPRERPKTRLVHSMPESHSDLLMSNMEKIVWAPAYMSSPKDDPRTKTMKKWTYQMAIVNALEWLGRHRRNHLDFKLSGFGLPADFKLFEDEETL